MKFSRHALLPLFVALSLLTVGGACRAENSPLPAAMASEEAGGPSPEAENDPQLYLQLIARMQEKNLYFASLAHLDAFERRWPGNARAALLRGDALRETEYFERAKAIYRNLLKGEQSAAAYHGLGIIAARQGDQRAALEALEKANQLAPTNVFILNDLGYSQLLAGRADDARLSLHKAAELDQRNSRVGGNLALLYLLENKPERAQGIMKWYQLPDSKRQEIYRKFQELQAVKAKSGDESAEFDANKQKIDKVEGAPRSARE
ncbi:MAG: tadD [Proteobacteria bacterium]|nr:tadD [Pseudomonadota bacterium]